MAPKTYTRELIQEKFEPKRKSRWVLTIPGIDAFLCKSATRPFAYKTTEGDFEFEVITVKFYDPIAPSGAKMVQEWMADPEPRTVRLEMLDQVGTVVETWEYEGVKIDTADFGEVDYSISDPVFIEVRFKFSGCTLDGVPFKIS